MKYHSWWRVPTPPPLTLIKTSIQPTPTFSNFVRDPARCSFSFVFFWLNGWLCHIWYVNLLNDIMDLHKASLGNLVQGSYGVFFIQEGIILLRSNAWHSLLLVLWFDITQIQRHAAHRGQYLHKYILTPPLCAHSSFLYYIM